MNNDHNADEDDKSPHCSCGMTDASTSHLASCELVLEDFVACAEPETKTFTVDITPLGMKTPEGAARVNATLETWRNWQARVANDATSFIKDNIAENFDVLRVLEHEVKAELRELQATIKEMNAAQEEFLRAVAGR